MPNRFHKPSLTIVTKVSLLAGSIAAIASFIVGSIIINGSTVVIYENALTSLKFETNLKSSTIVNEIRSLRQDVQYLAGLPPVSGIPRAMQNGGIDPFDNSQLSTWKNRLATIFTELLRAKPYYIQARYIGIADKGKEIVRVNRNESTIQRVPEDNLQTKEHRPYFQKSLKVKNRDVYLSDINLNWEYHKVANPDTAVIRAATPIYVNGALFGIIILNMNFKDIFDTLIKNTPRNFTPYVINEEGYFLSHPDKTMTFGFDTNTHHTIQDLYTNIDLNMTKDIRDTDFTIQNNGDVVHIVKAFYDPLDKNRFLGVILATSYDNLQAVSTRLKNKSFLVMALLVIISLVSAAFLTSRLMRPLGLISRASDNLALGREVTDLPIHSNDEIGELARSFDNMRRQLRNKERELIVSQGHVHQVNKMAALGEMAANMAHEINSPIQSINLIAQRIQRQLTKNISPEDINQAMENITLSVKNISKIIDGLRNISRDSINDDFVETRLSDLIDAATNMTEERFRINNVQLDVTFHDVSENTTIYCQEIQISQVLINLINNAYDAIFAMDKRWIKIDIHKLPTKIRFSITDSGNGIPSELQRIIFEPLFTTKDIGKGTGLGLSISFDIIKKHNGLLYINTESSNTCFILELPIAHTDKKI